MFRQTHILGADVGEDGEALEVGLFEVVECDVADGVIPYLALESL
jgi:hypothetical protein